MTGLLCGIVWCIRVILGHGGGKEGGYMDRSGHRSVPLACSGSSPVGSAGGRAPPGGPHRGVGTLSLLWASAPQTGTWEGRGENVTLLIKRDRD